MQRAVLLFDDSIQLLLNYGFLFALHSQATNTASAGINSVRAHNLIPIIQKVSIYAPVICNHCSPTYGEGWGIAGLKCGAITSRVSPQCRGNDRVLTLGSLPKGDFLLLRVGQRAMF